MSEARLGSEYRTLSYPLLLEKSPTLDFGGCVTAPCSQSQPDAGKISKLCSVDKRVVNGF